MAKSLWLLLAACLSHAIVSSHGYQFIGCYIDQGDRDLPDLAESGNVHVSRCNFLCTTRGFLFFALQDSNKCFCANSYGRYGVAPIWECNKRCRGNNNELCGSNWRNSLYASDFANTGARFVGCFLDGGHRDLPAMITSDSANSVPRCTEQCRSRNYLYAGLQFGNECWCGNDFGKHGERSEKDCRKRCPGFGNQFCGEAWRNSVFATGVRLVRLPAGNDPMSGELKAELAAQIQSQQVAFPGGVFCDRCLMAAWSRRDAEVRTRVFNVRDLDAVMASYPEKVREKLGVLRIGVNAKNTFEDFQQTISGNYVARSSFMGVARRSGDNVEMGIVNAELVAYLVPKHHVFQRQSCQSCTKIWFFRTETIRERIGYQASEIESIDQAMRSETFKLFRERLG